MSKIMLTSAEDLPYTMGNAGDLIKHCVLILFLDWFLPTIITILALPIHLAVIHGLILLMVKLYAD